MFFFSFLLFDKKKMPLSFSLIFLFLFEAKKVTTQTCHRLVFFKKIFFVENKATTTSLLLSPNFLFFVLEVKKTMLINLPSSNA